MHSFAQSALLRAARFLARSLSLVYRESSIHFLGSLKRGGQEGRMQIHCEWGEDWFASKARSMCERSYLFFDLEV